MEVTAYEPGTPSFIDLATSDLDGAKAFYSALMGWGTVDMPMGDGGVYTMLQKNGKDVAGAYEISEEMAAMGVPPHWVTYITVADADAAAAAVLGSGGAIIQEPFDVMNAGRMAVAQDPTGASFNMWQAKESIGSYLTREPGTLLWNELQTDDLEAAADFYADVLGWQTQATEMENGSIYTSFMLGEASVAGMMEIQPDWGPVPPNWSIYLEVEDADAAVEATKKLGGKQEMPVMEVPEAGRFVLIQDPQGAYLYVMAPPRD